MKKANTLFVQSIMTAILCGVWSCIAGMIGLNGWGGFAGCTTYFASGKQGTLGVKKAMATNLVGVACGMLIINLSELMPTLGEFGMWSAVGTFIMCIIARFELLDFCPGIFVGCFTTFAANGEWRILLPSLLVGALLGFACDYSGMWMNQKVVNSTK